jgi:hypothetical protein
MKQYLLTTLDILLAFIFIYGLHELTRETVHILNISWPYFLYGNIKPVVILLVSFIGVLAGVFSLRKGFFR